MVRLPCPPVQIITKRRKRRRAEAERNSRRLQDMTTQTVPDVPRLLVGLAPPSPVSPKSLASRPTVTVPALTRTAGVFDTSPASGSSGSGGARSPLSPLHRAVTKKRTRKRAGGSRLRRTQSDRGQAPHRKAERSRSRLVPSSRTTGRGKSESPPPRMPVRASATGTVARKLARGSVLRRTASEDATGMHHRRRVPQLQHTMSGRFSSIWKRNVSMLGGGSSSDVVASPRLHGVAGSTRKLAVSPHNPVVRRAMRAMDGGPSLPALVTPRTPLGGDRPAAQAPEPHADRRWKPRISEYHVKARSARLPSVQDAALSPILVHPRQAAIGNASAFSQTGFGAASDAVMTR